MKYILTVFIFLSIESSAKFAEVKVIDIDGETKNYTFYDSTESNEISTKNEFVKCEVAFEKGYAETGCTVFMLNLSVKKKSKLKKSGSQLYRSFTRSNCDGHDKSLLLLNFIPLKESQKIDGISIVTNCKE